MTMHAESPGLEMAMVTVDCVDPERLAAWWAGAVTGEVSVVAPGEFATVTSPQGPPLGFQRAVDPTPGKNRVHLDFRCHDRDRDVARLVASGATEVGRQRAGADFGWVVLADPEGNVFCVAGAS